ncbi:hypothetical protein K8I61_11160 [bacterium]|nr:hypothetical protein [bacterium]
MRLRYLLASVAVLALALFASGCHYVSHQLEPESFYSASDLKESNLEKFAHRDVTRSGFRLIYIPISMPSPRDTLDEVITLNHATGVTNLDLQVTELDLFLFQIPKVRICTDLVRPRRAGDAASHPEDALDHTHAAPAPPAAKTLAPPADERESRVE